MATYAWQITMATSNGKLAMAINNGHKHGKSYNLDPSWIINNGLDGENIHQSSFLQRNSHSNRKSWDATSHSSYYGVDASLYGEQDNEYQGYL